MGDDIFRFIEDMPGGSSAWSFTWRGLMKGLLGLTAGFKWRVGDVLSIRFWDDPWLLEEPIRKYLEADP